MEPEYYKIVCFCGRSYFIEQGSKETLTCSCGKRLTGLFGSDFQRRMEEETLKLLTTVRIGRFSNFTTTELADEVARRVKEQSLRD